MHGRWIVAMVIATLGVVLLPAASAGVATASSGGLVAIPNETVGGQPQLIALSPGQLHREVQLTFTLRRAQPAAFARYLAAVTDPGSPSYGRFLSQHQITARFGPGAAAYGAVLRWLRQGGFRGVSGSADRLTITATAPLAHVASALHVQFAGAHTGGRVAYVNVDDPRLPAPLARAVADVAGLSDLAVPATTLARQPAAPIAGQPATPLARQPAAPIAGQPATPLARQPAAPIAGQPATPLARQPAAPIAGQPATPLARQPAAPIAQQSATAGGLAADASPTIDLRASPFAAPSPASSQVVKTFQAVCLGGIPSVVGAYMWWTGDGFAAILKALLLNNASALKAIATSWWAAGYLGFCAGTGLSLGGWYFTCLDAAMQVGASAWQSPNCKQFNGFPNFGHNFGKGGKQGGKGGGGGGAGGGGAAAAAVAHVKDGPGGAAGTPTAARIGLLEFADYNPQDVQDFLTYTGSSAEFGALSTINVNGGAPAVGSDPNGETEALLDVDAVMVLNPLPGTSYVVYDAPSSTSFQTMFNTMIADGDTVISNSWSQCEDQTSQADADAIDSVIEQGEASGVTIVNATGDNGSSCLDGAANTIGVPADSPHAIAVGGTTVDQAAAAMQAAAGLGYPGESWWNGASHTPPTGAGGYGTSRYFAQPDYQVGITSSAMRSVPDVVEPADPANGMLICQADDGGCPTGLAVGGTSLAAPIFAALASYGYGLTPESLYSLANAPGVFHDADSMGSTFAQVGLGSLDLQNLLDFTENFAGSEQTGAPDPTLSIAAGAGPDETAVATDEVPADGATQGLVQVFVHDANGEPVSGATVTVTPSAPSNILPAGPEKATTDDDGNASFAYTDTTIESVTFTVTAAASGGSPVTLDDQPQLQFVEPVAAGGLIQAAPPTVVNDGSSQATITVDLVDALGRPAAGKTVSLTQSGHAVITPASGQAVTDANGVATFTATDNYPVPESVSFNATYVTPDGNLPVPGAATATFQPAASSPCSDALPSSLASGYTITPWASPLPYDPQQLNLGGVGFYACQGIDQPVFDPTTGNMYVADAVSGEIYVIGPTGGTPQPLPDASFPAGALGGLAFGSDGELYGALAITDNSYSDPEVVQLDPATGAVLRVVASRTSTPDALIDCPYPIATDPLSGDLFTGEDCTFNTLFDLDRISGPSSASPGVSAYTTDLPYTTGLASAGIAFAPDGTIYVAMPGSQKVVSVSGTNVSGSPIVTTLATFSSVQPFGVAVASVDGQGHATALDVAASDLGGAGGTITRIDLTATPATATTIASGGGSFQDAVLGPDGCVYVMDLDQILRLSGGGGCAVASSDTPGITLTSSGPSPAPTGATVTLTATLTNFAHEAGVPVHFADAGANQQTHLAYTNAAGEAQWQLTGQLTGGDEIEAAAPDGQGDNVDSAPVQQRWTTGQDATFLDLDQTLAQGVLGQPVSVTASLYDISDSAPLAGQQLTLSLGGQQCTTTTDSGGQASCSFTPGQAGTYSATAAFAGSASDLTSSASTDVTILVAAATTTTTTTVTSTAAATTTQSTSTTATQLTTRTSTTTTTTTSKHVTATAHPASVCGAVTVDLLDVYVARGRLHLLGYANPRLAGKRVTVEATRTGKAVAHATVGASGYFSATAPPPPAAQRSSNATRYAASVGSDHSPALKLSRRLYIFSISRTGGGVSISGQVEPPLAAKPAAIVTQLRVSCQSTYRIVKTKVKLDRRSGDFTIKAPAPPAADTGAVYLLSTKVPAVAGSSRLFSTDSLPRTVG